MKIRVRFFSHLRELAEATEIDLELSEATSVTSLLDLLYQRTPALRPWDKSILVAVGLEFVSRDYVLRPEEDVSIMPPVQGG